MTITQELIDAERVKFEASAELKYLDFSKTKDAWGKEIYFYTHVEAMWQGWQAAISQHKAVQDVYSHEDIARLLITIGWRCDGDAQWTRIKEAMPRLRTMLAAPSDNKALVESEPVYQYYDDSSYGWNDCHKEFYDAWHEKKRIVYAAPQQAIPSGMLKAPEHAEIYVSDGLYALVDWEDFNTVKGYKWSLTTRNRTKNVTGCLYAQAWSTENVSTRKRISMHRLIMPDAACIDHINGNGLDNRRANLRAATIQQNAFNMTKTSGSSIYKGVSFEKNAGLWRSYIRHDNKRLHLGKFENEIDAARAYDSKAKELFGEYANTNF